MAHINIIETIGADVRSRSAVDIICKFISSTNTSVILDFEGVSFISRSFSDELCVLISQFPEIEICNMTTGVKNMFEVVKNSRSKKRIRSYENVVVKNFDNMKELSAYLRNKM